MDLKRSSPFRNILLILVSGIPLIFLLLRESLPEHFFPFFTGVFAIGILFFRNNFLYVSNPRHSKWNIYEIIFVVLLLSLAFSIRLYRLGELGLWWDEFLTGTYVKSILQNGIPISPSGNEYYWRGIPYHYLTAFFCLIGGENEFMLRLPNVFLSVGILFISYLFSRKINKNIAIFVLIFLTFSPYNIEYAQFARFYTFNNFLFLIGLWTVWQGIWGKKRIFLVLSIIIHLLLNLNSELGNIILGIVLVAGTLRFFFDIKEKKTMLFRKILGIFIPFFALYLLGNPFYFFEKELPQEAKKEYQSESVNRKGVFLNIPTNSLSNLQFETYDFYQKYHIPFWFLLPLIFTIFSSIQKKGFRKYSPCFQDFLLFSLLFSSGIFDIINTFDKAPRLYAMFEPLIVILIFSSVSIVTKTLTENRMLRRAIYTSFLMLLFFSIHPFFWNQIHIQYGDNVEKNPFRSTWSQKLRTDSKTILQFLNANYREGDVWINTMEYTTFYTDLRPDYVLNENYRWKSMWREFALINPKTEEYFDLRTGATILPSLEAFLHVLEEKKRQEKRVWVTVHGANVETLYTIHLRERSKSFFQNSAMSEVYLSPDGVSAVYLY